MKGWPYSELTHNAAQAGGVEKYIASIRQAGFSDGKTSMYPWIPVAICGGYVLKWDLDKAVEVYKSWKHKRENLKIEEEVAKSQLVSMCSSSPVCEGEA